MVTWFNEPAMILTWGLVVTIAIWWIIYTIIEIKTGRKPGSRIEAIQIGTRFLVDEALRLLPIVKDTFRRTGKLPVPEIVDSITRLSESVEEALLGLASKQKDIASTQGADTGSTNETTGTTSQ